MKTNPAFELIKKQQIKETRTEARFYRHKKTGAEILSMVNDDENKVFGITFRTPPDDSTGVAHILEHSVLCGSRKYPVKEPFVELLKGSLQTFLNAFTYPDKTCYPVASQNLQDFYNLIDVYLDAVFYPRLTPQVFQQEGWHYETDEKEGGLSYKGVVYNEMKGVYSSPSSLLSSFSQHSLFPDTTYGLDSGGDPGHIPDLTFDELMKFHKKYYHPSNSRIYFYGNDDPERRLYIIENYLKDYDRMEVDSSIKLQYPLDRPRAVKKPFISGDEDGKNAKGMITLNWLLPETVDAEINFAFHILEYILIGMPASPLRKALIDSGMGEGLAGVGLENELRQMYFSTGLKGIDVKNSGKIEGMILETLGSLVKEKIDRLTVEAALNTIEFSLREQNTGGFPRGLSQMLLSLTTWLYDSDPLMLLAFEKPLEKVKKQIAKEENFFEDMIERYLIKNPHRTTVILNPDSSIVKKRSQEDADKLKDYRAKLDSKEIDKIIENNKILNEMQNTPDTPEALASIPALDLSDLEQKNKIIPVSNQRAEGTDIYYHDLFTNDIVYLDIGFNLRTIPGEYLPYIPLFGQALLEMGTEKEDYVKLSQRINSKTGGIRRSYFTSMIRGTDESTAWMFLRCKAMPRQVKDLFLILRDILMTVKLDNRDRFRQIVLQLKAGREQSIIPQGNRVVNLRLRSCFNESDWANEQMNGLSSIFFLRRLAERIDNDWQGILRDLEAIRSILIDRSALIVNTTVDETNWKNTGLYLKEFLEKIPDKKGNNTSWDPGLTDESEGLVVPSNVNFVGKGSNLYDSKYKFHGSAHVIARYLRTTWLWERVRMQGGAYGAMCSIDELSGIWTFLSYRDPNILKTLDIYNRTAEHLKTVKLTLDEITRCIIGVIGDIDSYMLPDAKGYSSMLRILNGNTDEIRQQRREEILNTGESDFRDFADSLDSLKDKGITRVLGGQKAIDEAVSGRPGWLKILKVM